MSKREDVPIDRQYTGQARTETRNYLMVIGISTYSHGIGSLNNAAADAIAFRDCLLKQYQFQKEHCISLLNAEATYDNIITQFDNLTSRVGEQDNLVFYYSGHGTFLNSIDTGFWLLANSQKGKRQTFLPNDEVVRFMRNSKAKHIFGVVDSCFSGSLFRNSSRTIPSRRYHFKSRYLLTSGRMEAVEDGPPGKHSPFSQCLLDYLKDNPDDHIWGGSVCRAVLDNFTYDNTQQAPCGEPMHGVGHRSGEFVFLRKNASFASIKQDLTDDNPTPAFDKAYAQPDLEKSDLAAPITIHADGDGQININYGHTITNNHLGSNEPKDKERSVENNSPKLKAVDFQALRSSLNEGTLQHGGIQEWLQKLEEIHQLYLKQPQQGLLQLNASFLASIASFQKNLENQSLPNPARQHLQNNLDSLYSIFEASPFAKSSIEGLINETRLLPEWYQMEATLTKEINFLSFIITSWCKSI